jgi:hypothetical protein
MQPHVFGRPSKKASQKVKPAERNLFPISTTTRTTTRATALIFDQSPMMPLQETVQGLNQRRSMQVNFNNRSMSRGSSPALSVHRCAGAFQDR